MRRRLRRPAGLAVLVLLATPLQASASAAGPALLMSPSTIPEEPHPIPLRAEVEGDPDTSYELKAWVGSPDRQASRTWNGTDWHRSDHYVRTVETDASGTWRGWVHVRVNPDGAGYPDLVDDADEAGLHLRARPASGGEARTASAAVRILEGENTTWRTGRAADASLVAAGGPEDPASLALVASDPRLPPAPANGRYRIPVPEDGPPLRRLGPDGGDLGPVREPAPPPLRLAEVVPHAYGTDEGAEAVAVANAGGEPADLEGVCLAARGRACLPGGTLAPGEALRLARNASAYEAATGRQAREYPPALDGEAFGLPDGGGVLELAHLGTRLDGLAWGDPPPEEAPPRVANVTETPHPGEVLRRDPPPGAGEPGGNWTGGTRLGQTRLEPATFPLEGRAWTAVAPGESYDLLAGLLRRAEERIRVEAYLLTSPSLAGELARALDRGVEVSVLVEGSPVGGRPAVEDRILAGLEARGADVAVMSSRPGFRARYPTVHAKVATVDGEVVAVSSENLARSGYPPGGEEGNRGWVVAVEDRDLASYVGEVLSADRAPRPDVQPVDPGGRGLPPRPVAPPPEMPPARNASGGSATPVMAPDTSRHPETVEALLASARASVDVQLLSLETRFGEEPNPYVEALLGAARRGVEVRVLLDGTYVDEATGRAENEAPRAALEAAAREEDLPLEVRLGGRLDVSKVHNKGVVVDGERVLVGSINWVEPALTRNRELGLIVDAPAVAAPFEEAFDRDWRASLPSAGVVPPAPGFGAAGAAAALVAAVVAGRR